MSYFTLLEAILKPILDEDLLPLNHILLGKHFVRFDYENSTHCFPYDRPDSKLRLLQQALLWIADTEFDHPIRPEHVESIGVHSQTIVFFAYDDQPRIVHIERTYVPLVCERVMDYYENHPIATLLPRLRVLGSN